MTLPENYHPHSRYTLKEAPWGYQAADIIHSDISGPVFDLGVDLDDRHGIAYIRVTDIEEMARVLGMATREEVLVYKKRIEELNAEVLLVPREVESLKDGLSNLVSDFLDRVVPRNSDNPVDDKAAGEESREESESSEGLDSGASKDAEQNSDAPIDERSDELSSDSVDGFGFGSLTKSK